MLYYKYKELFAACFLVIRYIESALKDIHNKYCNETYKRIAIVYFDDIKEAQYRNIV